ncbi:MAG: carbon-nitrogen hydrolase family protein [candidate division Zixibacteria bacterium]|nr:carbon-nitrogen hydrolase family protein [candidate division Zixibacteria bacterium]
MAGIMAAIVQMDAQDNVQENRKKAVAGIAQAADQGARIVVLPEMFVYVHSLDRMRQMAEPLHGPTSETLREAARRHGVYLVGGTFFECIPGQEKVYNTNLFIGPDGNIRTIYRKIHLFELIAPGEVVVVESQAVEHGQEVVTDDTPFGTIGITICYDLRFPELYRALADRGAHIVAVPAAFAMKTGRDHWEVLLRARAIENQVYVLACNQVGIKPDASICYGRSMIIDPWGTVVAQASDAETVIMAELDMEYLEKVRTVLPALKNRRIGQETTV